MRPDTKNFNRGAAKALGNERVQANLLGLNNGFHRARLAAADGTPDWELMREQARAIKAHTIDNLDYYLELAASSVERAGGTVFFAKDADAAAGYVTDLALARGVKLVIKGKSMVSEEMSLNDRLTNAGIEPVECLPGGMPRQDQHPPHAPPPAQGGDRGTQVPQRAEPL